MSKNLTRKGLALGALVALSSTLFAGAPALAGTESAKVTLVPSAGTTYTTLIGASFDFKTELDPTLKTIESKTLSELSYVITNSSAQKLSIDLDGASGADFGNVIYRTGDTADAVGSAAASATTVPATTAAGASKAIVVTHATTSTNAQSADAADIGANTLRIVSSTDSTDAFAVTVQAFIDDNNNGLIDTFELTSPARTLNFIKASSATVTTTVTSAVIGSNTLKGTVVIGNDVNNRSLVGQVSIGFFKNAAAYKLRSSAATPPASADTVDVQWDTTDSVLTNTTYNQTDALATASYTAKAYFGVARSVLGEESAAVTPVNGTVASADHTDGLVAAGSANNKATVSNATAVKTGYTGAVKFTANVVDASNNKAKAASKVKITLTKGGTFTAGHEISAGGKTLTSTSGAVSYETTTGTDGIVVVEATSNKGTSGDIYTIKVETLKPTGGWSTGETNTVTFTDEAIQSFDTVDFAGNNAVLSVAKGGSLTLNYQVRNNFGALSTVAGTYRVSFSDSGSNNGTAAVVGGTVAVSGGKATLNWTDNSVASTGSYVVRATLEKLNDAGTAYTSTGKTKDVTIYVGTKDVVAISVPDDSTTATAKSIDAADFVAHDLRLDTNSKTWASISLDTNDAFTVSGTATSSNGAVVPGALVTISAKGLQFVAANGADNTTALLALDTITVRATSSGAYSVAAYSHITGDVKITVTSGAAKSVVTAKFKNATTADADSKLAITGAAITKSGRSTGYLIALTDKWGNAIKGAVTIKVEQAGAGYLVSTPTAVSAVDGKTNVTLITQPADGGLATLTVTYDVAGSDTDVVAKKDILVGVSASITKAATSKVTIKNAAGLTVKVVRGTKSATKTATSDSYKVSLKGGKGTVSVYVNGVKVASK